MYSWLAGEVAAFLLAALVVDVVAQVLFRYVLGDPLMWADEVARYLAIWVTFLGSVWALESKQHFVVDALVQWLPQTLGRPLAVLANLGVLAILFIFVRYGTTLTLFNMNRASPTMGLPFGVVYLSIPLGGLLMAGIVIRDTLRILVRDGSRGLA
jgi:TRAP-type C4-dicarboxylate transport system permease small subunit